MTGNIPFYVAFGAGVLSFLSPCVLPLVPGYLSFVSGVNMAAARTDGGVEASAHRREVVLSAAVGARGGHVDARHERQVARHQRQHAGRDERQYPCDQGAAMGDVDGHSIQSGGRQPLGACL